ncbi:MAG: PD-(D/E)XK motif protein [Clostridium lundense]|nr:PD-(D/E)XK motif protein [Clostridium lundense]
MLETVKKIFEEEKVSKAYRRINSSHPINIYLGYNSVGEKSLVVIEESMIKNATSTRMIKVILGKREDGKIKLEFSLMDKLFEELFYKFCEDIVFASQNSLKEHAIEDVVNRWTAWKTMFQNANNEVLSDSIVQGLIGELLFIKNYMIPKYGFEQAITSWEGPVGGHKDFVIADTWYEVKTCSFSSDTVKISSLEQLDSINVGYLKITRIEKTNETDANAVNLNLIVEEIKEKILSVDILKLYYEKLSNLKYNYNVLYDKLTFKIGAEKLFEVNENFPRIRRKEIPAQVQSIQYELRISNLMEG